MKLDEGKLILTETELAEVKKANVMASPSIAGLYLRSFIKNKNLVEELAKLLEAFTPVKGRMTVIDQGQPFEVIVDYAHTPSSFQTIFPPIRNRCKGKMICVFGSGGFISCWRS